MSLDDRIKSSKSATRGERGGGRGAGGASAKPARRARDSTGQHDMYNGGGLAPVAAVSNDDIKKEVAPTPVIEDGRRKKKKKTKKEVVPTPDAPQVEHKKKKVKKEVVALEVPQAVEDGEGKRKRKVTSEDGEGKEKKRKATSEDGEGEKEKRKVTSEDIEGKKKKRKVTSEDGEGEKKKRKVTSEDGEGKKKKRKVTSEDGEGEKENRKVTSEDIEGKKKKRKVTSEDGEGEKKKRKVTSEDSEGKKKKRKITCDETGSVKKTILKPQSNGAGLDRKRKKKVTFQLPDRVEDELSEKELRGEETELLEELTWKADKLRPGLVYGMYTPKEDGILKKAIFDYIQEQGWDREEGLEKILNSRRSEARGCWHVIRKCLPQRELKRIYSRAHRILGPNTLLGKWSDEESQSLIELHSVHGNDWKRIALIVGRDPEACKDKWRQVKWSKSKDYKSGAWSEEEHQKLCKLVLKCLHVKAQMAKKGLITKTNRMVRDDINWEFIAEQMGGRSRLDCLYQWYRKMASPMVTTGEWSNGDDQRILERLMEEFPLSEELVEWDSLLKNRSGETCKKRWEQMQRTLGRGPEVRHQHFLEKLESIMKRFAPHLLDSEYDQKFAEDMQRADDADESEGADV